MRNQQICQVAQLPQYKYCQVFELPDDYTVMVAINNTALCLVMAKMHGVA